MGGCECGSTCGWCVLSCCSNCGDFSLIYHIQFVSSIIFVDSSWAFAAIVKRLCTHNKELRSSRVLSPNEDAKLLREDLSVLLLLELRRLNRSYVLLLTTPSLFCCSNSANQLWSKGEGGWSPNVVRDKPACSYECQRTRCLCQNWEWEAIASQRSSFIVTYFTFAAAASSSVERWALFTLAGLLLVWKYVVWSALCAFILDLLYLLTATS